jgi:uncharacterized membrane protein YbhN (UPF0104 family)
VLSTVLAVARHYVRRLPAPDTLPPQAAIVRCYGWAVVNMVAFAAAFAVLLRGTADVSPLEAGAAMCAGWVVGYLAVFVPAGVGVRESVLYATIPALSIGSVTAVSVVHRMSGLVAEVSLAGLALLRQRRVPPSSTTSYGHEEHVDEAVTSSHSTSKAAQDE